MRLRLPIAAAMIATALSLLTAGAVLVIGGFNWPGLLAGGIVSGLCGLAAWLIAKPVSASLDSLAQQIAFRQNPSTEDDLLKTDEFAALQRAWADAKKRMEDVFSSQKAFTSNAAHELRTPLAALRLEGETALHSQSTESEPLREAIGAMLEEAQRVNQLVDRLLMLARAESGRIEVEADYQAIGPLVREVCELLQPLAEAKGQQLNVHEEAPWSVWVDPKLLRIALENLVANAIHHTPEDTFIEVRITRIDTGGVAIDIKDQGSGIREDDRDRIFDRFFRGLHSSAVPGSGLGLPIARWAAQAFGAGLFLKESDDDGSIFRIHCPETEWDYFGDASGERVRRFDHAVDPEWLISAEAGQLLARFGTSRLGLSPEAAYDRRLQAGQNRFQRGPDLQPLKDFGRAVRTPFNGILSICLGLSLLLGEMQPAIIMGLMIALSTGLRFWQERRSLLAVRSLEEMVAIETDVARPDHREPVKAPIEDLVPGDVIHLSPGDMVPADIRLLSAHGLQVSEATLTGESYPQAKTARALEPGLIKDPQNADNLCFMGTHVVGGSAIGMVYATGLNTRLGKQTRPLQSSPTSRFELGVRRVSVLLLSFMAALFPAVLLINGLFKGNWPEALMFSLAVAVGLTPELLPMIVNVNLARVARKLSRRGLIIKNLNAVHAFGSMDLLWVDKTGTLTRNEPEFLSLLGADEDLQTKGISEAYLNAHFQGSRRSHLDDALIRSCPPALKDAARQDWRLVYEIPYDYERRRVSVIAQKTTNSEFRLISKGAPESLLDACSHYHSADGSQIIDANKRVELISLLQTQLDAGNRVLAVADRKWDTTTPPKWSVAAESHLCFIGFLVFRDPLRNEVAQTIQYLKEAEVDVRILTGDHPAPALAVAREAGIDTGNSALTGSQIDELDDPELLRAGSSVRVFARLSPSQKARVVRVFKEAGRHSGFLGEGANDANALREADIGFATSTGAVLARECAAVVVSSKDLSVLKEGIDEGRIAFANILKYIKITASSNFGNAFSVVLASLVLPFLPMRAVQLLVQNLLYDFAQLALPWDRVDDEFRSRPRNWSTSSIRRFMLVFGPISSVFDLLTFAFLWYIIGANTIAQQALFQTGWFVVGISTQLMIIHILRTGRIPFVESLPTRPVAITGIFAASIALILPFIPLGDWLGFTALPLPYLWWVAFVVLAYAISAQLAKRIYQRHFGEWL